MGQKHVNCMSNSAVNTLRDMAHNSYSVQVSSFWGLCKGIIFVAFCSWVMHGYAGFVFQYEESNYKNN